jgi:uncharacterized membrane protein
MVLLPVALTISVISFFVNFFTAPFVGIVSAFLKTFPIGTKSFLFLSPEKTTEVLAKLLILIALFFLIALLGKLTRWALVRWFLSFWEKIVHKIPIAGTIYKSTKELMKNFLSSQGTAFKQVVLVPFPKTGIYALGFIAGPSLDQATLSVLVPTTPNPTSGFLLFYKKEDLIFLEMKPEEAFKYILSFGLLPPAEKS